MALTHGSILFLIDMKEFDLFAMHMSISLIEEPKSCIVQNHKMFAPKSYTAGFLHTDSLNVA